MSQELQWGESSKIGITKKDIDSIIKNYVKENYPLKVEKFHNDLKVQKEDKLKKFLNVTFISGDLMWQDNKDNKDLLMSKLEAKIYCKKLNLATKRDWRLPKYDEMLTLVNYFRYKPAVIDDINHIAINRYWTASENSSDVSATWYVDFKFGETGSALRYLKYNVRCVRDISQVEGEF